MNQPKGAVLRMEAVVDAENKFNEFEMKKATPKVE